MRRLQLDQLLAGGVALRQAAAGSDMMSLARMALLGVLFAYAYIWLRSQFKSS
jgi:hypothetical protein